MVLAWLFCDPGLSAEGERRSWTRRPACAEGGKMRGVGVQAWAPFTDPRTRERWSRLRGEPNRRLLFEPFPSRSRTFSTVCDTKRSISSPQFGPLRRSGKRDRKNLYFHHPAASMVRSSAMQALCLFGLLAASMVEAFAPMTALPRANLALRRSAARPTMALSAVPLSSVGAAKAGLALQTSAATAQILVAPAQPRHCPCILTWRRFACVLKCLLRCQDPPFRRLRRKS